MELQGEVALVTGGSRGIGRASAIMLAKAGAEVVINYAKSEAQAQKVCEEITAAGGKATCVQFDVSDPDSIKNGLAAVLKEKKFTILVNNSGISRDGLFMRYSLEDWDQVVDTNLRGAFLTTQAVIRGMIKARKGSIINVSSIVGVTGNPGQSAYCASKAGLIGLTKSMAKELASRNIRVNAIAPGYIETDMTDTLTEEQKKAMLEHVPLGRAGKVEEIADVVLFLASPRSNYITGQTLIADGGLGM